MNLNEATEYAVALNECDETITSKESAERVASLFLEPKALFRLWIDAMIYKYWK